MKLKGNTIKISKLFPICIVLFFCVFFIKILYVALTDTIDGINIKELENNRTTQTDVIEATRGTIYDYDGNALAQNVNSYNIIAYLSPSRTTNPDDPKHVVDKVKTAKALSEILYPGKDQYEYVLNLLSQDNLYQTELGSGGRNISETTKINIEKLDLPGIDFVKTYKRYYQNGDFASYIIGYAKKKTNEETNESELVGELGIEGFCDRFLKGKNGSITYQKDAYGYKMADKISYTKNVKNGYNVYLTIDKQVQIFLNNTVQELLEYNPEWVTLTIANAKTGAIIGSATSPSFDPNKLNIVDYNNPLVSKSYEPGSTMKIFSFMSSMEEGLYNGDEKYHSGNIQVDDYKISDWNKYGWGDITYDKGFTYSSNVAAVNLAQKLGKAKLRDYYTKLGFGTKTGIELANEYDGDISFEYNSEVASASYGQGITITPIQMIQALTTITNDGVLLKPYIIDKIVDPDSNEVVYQSKRNEIRKVYSTATVNKIIDIMDQTVNSEDKAVTGHAYKVDGVRLIGKTGTADYVSSSGKYSEGSDHAIRSFAGIFPREDPEYIIYVAVKDFKGGTAKMGTSIKKLVESISKYKNLGERVSDKNASKIVTMPKLQSKSILSAKSELNKLGIEPIIIGDGSNVIDEYPKYHDKTSINAKVFLLTNGNNYIMPDVSNWSSKDIIAFCDIIGLKYNLNGYGYVVNTSIPTGSSIDLNSTIDINLVNIIPESLIDGDSVDGKKE